MIVEGFPSTTLTKALIQLGCQFNKPKDLLLFVIRSMHDELNNYGNKKIDNFPKYDERNPQEAFNYFMKVHRELNLSIISTQFYGILMEETQCYDQRKLKCQQYEAHAPMVCVQQG